MGRASAMGKAVRWNYVQCFSVLSYISYLYIYIYIYMYVQTPFLADRVKLFVI